MWARMPYKKKPTTPTTTQEVEGALVVGYWLAYVTQGTPHICKRHQTILDTLTKQEEQRVDSGTDQATRKGESNTAPLFIPPNCYSQTTQPAIVEEFKIGPGPLVNENSVTQAPPLPVVADPSAPYRVKAKPGTIEGALEAAKMPPVEGRTIGTYTCTCGEEVIVGSDHTC